MQQNTHSPLQEESKNIDPLHWFAFFEAKIRSKIHLDTLVQRCFKAFICNQVAPNHFSYVFWKAPFVFDREQWQLADEIVPNLYNICMSYPSAAYFRNDVPPIEVIINYAVWRGHFSWLYSLASLYYQRDRFHCELFQLATLCLAYNENFDTANFYHRQTVKQVANTSPYYEHCFRILMGDHAKDIVPEQETVHTAQNVQYAWLVSCCNGDLEQEKELMNSMTRISVDEEVLLDQYSCLVARGLLFRANRMILRYLAEKDHCEYLVHIVLQSYLQNQKYYSYLQRLIDCKFWPGKICWYEAEYCILKLGLNSDKKRIWLRIQNRKREVLLPDFKEQKTFQSLLQKAENQSTELSQSLPNGCTDLLLDHHLSTASSKHHLLQRRYSFYLSFILEPLTAAKDLSPNTIISCNGQLFWTFYLYLDTLHVSPFIKLLESLSGQVLSLRLLLAVYHFRYGSREKSSKLLSSVAHCHPLFQTMSANLSIAEGELQQADRISSKLVKKISTRLRIT